MTAVLAALAKDVAESSAEEEEPSEDEAPQPCRPRVAPTLPLHPSHHLRSRGVWSWCARCGCFSSGTKFRRLQAPCVSITPCGKQALNRIRKGLPPALPRGRQLRWGDVDESDA